MTNKGLVSAGSHFHTYIKRKTEHVRWPAKSLCRSLELNNTEKSTLIRLIKKKNNYTSNHFLYHLSAKSRGGGGAEANPSWPQVRAGIHAIFTYIHTHEQFREARWCNPHVFVGENQRKLPTQARGEHRKNLGWPTGLTPEASCCEETVLITAPLKTHIFNQNVQMFILGWFSSLVLMSFCKRIRSGLS